MNGTQADAYIASYLTKGRAVYEMTMNSLKKGQSPITAFINLTLFSIKTTLLLEYFRYRRFMMWNYLNRCIKDGTKYYLSRHHYRYDSKDKSYTIKSYRFLMCLEQPVLSFKQDDVDHLVMYQNDMASKRTKRHIYETMMDKYVYITIYVMLKAIKLNYKLEKKRTKQMIDDYRKKDITG